MYKRDKKEEMEFEIQFYEGIVRHKPDFVEALAALGDVYTRRGFFRKGLEIDQRLARLRPSDPVVLYNLACSYSLLHDVDHSLRAIKKAIQNGYSDFQHMKTDSDLDNLRNDMRFKKYFQSILKKKVN